MQYPKPHSEWTADGRQKLLSDYVCHVNSLGVDFVIPAGFIWDGLSIPRIFWVFVGHPYSARGIVPSLVHDWLCDRLCNYPERLLADAVFFYLLSSQGVPYWRRALLYGAVRIWGRVKWWR